jgi:hypothetical protein
MNMHYQNINLIISLSDIALVYVSRGFEVYILKYMGVHNILKM